MSGLKARRKYSVYGIAVGMSIPSHCSFPPHLNGAVLTCYQSLYRIFLSVLRVIIDRQNSTVWNVGLPVFFTLQLATSAANCIMKRVRTRSSRSKSDITILIMLEMINEK